ncbi:MAG: response regulator [Bacillota bacterium]|jgi:two-component system response regulator (stage 0 sporulation protein F)|nr:response regulator [Clostridia bacterium]
MSREVKRDYSDYSILVVDDQLGVRKLLCEALKDEFKEVRSAANGIEAISIVENSFPDLVVMDMKMPRMNGLELLKHLRSIGYYNPVIMMTAYGELEIVSEAAKMGVKNYITKPFDLQDLRKQIKDTLKITGAAEED